MPVPVRTFWRRNFCMYVPYPHIFGPNLGERPILYPHIFWAKFWATKKKLKKLAKFGEFLRPVPQSAHICRRILWPWFSIRTFLGPKCPNLSAHRDFGAEPASEVAFRGPCTMPRSSKLYTCLPHIVPMSFFLSLPSQACVRFIARRLLV